MALKRTFDVMNSNGNGFQSCKGEPDEGRHDCSSLSKEDCSRRRRAILEHLRKRLPQHQRSIHKKGQSQDQPMSLSNLKAIDTPLNFLSLGPGGCSYRSPQAHGSVQGFSSGQEVCPQSSSGNVMRPEVSKERQLNTQLTIFYSGVVKVYDNVPADEAYAIMLLAGTGSSCSSQIMSSPSTETQLSVPSSPGSILPTCTAASSASSSTARDASVASGSSMEIPSSSVSVVHQSTYTNEMEQHRAVRRIQSELPFARKASLARFLEERKDRLIADKLAVKPGIDQMSSQTQEMSQTPGNVKRRCSRSLSRMIKSTGLDTARHQQSSAINNQQWRPLAQPRA